MGHLARKGFSFSLTKTKLLRLKAVTTEKIRLNGMTLMTLKANIFGSKKKTKKKQDRQNRK